MGYVTNDPKKGDEQLPGGHGLVVDLGLMACPSCRRELPDWEPICATCGERAVPRAELGPAAPPVPAHLLADEDEDGDDRAAGDEAG
jgi:hypothetical protein